MTSQTKAVEQNRTKQLVINAMFIALTFLATMCVNIRLPIMANGGLIHLGNVPLFVGAILFGKKTGALAGAFGMALFDFVSGWTVWAPFTFLIMGVIGYCIGLITEKEFHIIRYSIAMIAALIIKIGGYYIAEGIIYSNWIAPASSIPGNIMQILVAAIVTLPIIVALKKVIF